MNFPKRNGRGILDLNEVILFKKEFIRVLFSLCLETNLTKYPPESMI